MQVSTYNVIKDGFVLNRDCEKIMVDSLPAEIITNSSYDLTIRDIISSTDGNNESVSYQQDFLLKPQQSIYLVSEEYIRVPKGHVAYVFLKNRFSKKGLLALNTGIIDENYYGPISTLVLNLSREEQPIDATHPEKNKFFRIVFHKIEDELWSYDAEFPKEELKEDYGQYTNDRVSELKKLPDTFLNNEQLKAEVSNEIEGKISKISIERLMFNVALLGLVFTFFSIGRDYYFSSKFNIDEYIKSSIQNETKSEKLSKELEELRERIVKLEKETTSQQTEVNEN